MDATPLSSGDAGMVKVPLSALGRRISYRWTVDGLWIEIVTLITTPKDWMDRPESKSVAWQGREVGGLVFAVRCVDL